LIKKKQDGTIWHLNKGIMFNNISCFRQTIISYFTSFPLKIENCMASATKLPIINKVSDVATRVFKQFKSYQPESNKKNIKSFAMVGVLFMIFIMFKAIFSKNKPTPTTPNNSFTDLNSLKKP
jgi:hypothetical protein